MDPLASIPGKPWVFAGLCLLVAGCPTRQLKPVAPCTISGVIDHVRVNNIENLDLLLMVDNSESMRQEQLSLDAQIPRLIRVLASGDIDADGVQDFPPVRSIHVGVVSSDLGDGGTGHQSCERNPPYGDDGVMISEVRSPSSSCPADLGRRYFALEPKSGDASIDVLAAQLANDVSCVAANLGITGCGYEQQLDAVVKALVPHDAGIAFSSDTTGHGDLENRGFLRPDSLLAIIVLTDEDDCSTADPGLFGPSYNRPGEHPNLRCHYFGDESGASALRPAQELADTLLGLRADDKGLLVFGVIAGVPESLSGGDHNQILHAPEMTEVVAPSEIDLEPACVSSGGGDARPYAYPARRLVRVAQQLELGGASTAVHSICSADYTPAIQDVIDKIASVLRGSCLPHELNRAALTGQVACEVVEVLSAPRTLQHASCADLPGREDAGMTEGRRSCRMIQRVPAVDAEGHRVVPTEPGWFYDDFTEQVAKDCKKDHRRIAFAEGSLPLDGSDVRLECSQPTQQTTTGVADIGTTCDQPGATCVAGSLCARDLKCEGQTGTWQVPCDNDAGCTAAGLVSHVCASLVGFDFAPGTADDFDFALCVNPTCGS